MKTMIMENSLKNGYFFNIAEYFDLAIIGRIAFSLAWFLSL